MEPEEFEWQFEADDLSLIELWVRNAEAKIDLRATDAGIREIEDHYLDTADWLLYHEGYSLRIRRQGEQVEATLKTLESGNADYRRRGEITEALAEPAIDTASWTGDVAAVLHTVIGPSPLQPLFLLYTTRTVFTLSREDSDLGELTLDQTRVVSSRDATETGFQRVEVEVFGMSNLVVVQPYVQALQNACGLRPTASTKFGAAMSACGYSNLI